MRAASPSIVLGFAFAVLFQTNFVSGIKCFQCNSANNSACTNLETYTKGFLYPTLCDEEGGYPSEPFCRKTVLKVLDKVKNPEPRIIRSCGYIKHKKPCYTADNEGHMEKVCQCFEDGCNAGTSLNYKNAVFIVIPLGILYKVLHY